ncbi:MAG: ClbS/DfsB family four-helix bundle protein [Chloroflexi bacterium]|nr:ClbS/DfsB family four-helix bundle protein [Chloroflexota bacterium]
MDKAEVLQNVEAESQNLQEAVKGLDNDQMAETWLDGWSAKDILAHVLGWDREMIVFLERLARGERPAPEGVDYSDPNAWNAKFALEFAPISGSTVLAIWRQVHMNFLRAAKALPDDRFGEKDGKPKTANRMLADSGYQHYQEHTAQILEWRKSAGI